VDETQVIQDQVDAYNARDLDRFLSYYSADASVEDGVGAVMMQGHDAMRGMYDALFSQSPSLHVEILRRIHVGQWVVDEEHVTGAELSGFPPEFTAVLVYQVDNGMIARARLLL
jgi:hypothetical protein